MKEVISYAVRYYFFGVPRDKHYGYRSFANLSEAIDFADRLDPGEVESYDIASVAIIGRKCISDKYCPATTQCRRCKYKREELDIDG